MTLQRRAENYCSKLSPDILVRSEKNAKDLEKVLLHRALIIKDERIKKLENTNLSLKSYCMKQKPDQNSIAKPRLDAKMAKS